ncbi:hypothetical protein [Treponema sp.]|uniref:hypothetical protein n=1 Tax=Treponema sp. TaxID=166 RepID=UPI0025EB485D|nr:hypothetical protein [Treponema sp.]MCR5218946.1 hypothetical protein [Treponema sp.]
MATTANILTLLKYYTSKQKSPFVEYNEFADYIHRYAQHHMSENADLVVYCGASYLETLDEEIQHLVGQKQAVITSIHNKDHILVVPYLVEHYAAIYRSIETTVTVPYPIYSDIPKNCPTSILTQVSALDTIYELLDKQELSDRILYTLVFDKGVPSILFPSNVSVQVLISSALAKLQHLLAKGESHDYFLKKLSISNPGKELSIKSFFTQFVTKPEAALDVIKDTGETFYYWSQLFYFIKQDYTKLKDFTPEDMNILQAVAIAEIATSYYKSKASERQVKNEAFELLDRLLKNPPYYHSMADILKMKDPTGVLLLGQYKEDELKAHLDFLTTDAQANELPNLLIFKVSEDEGYFICKEKVMPLIIRLTNDARVLIRESLVKQWYKVLLDFETLPEMKETAAFERCLERELSSCEPILYGLLNSTFLSVIAFDDRTPGRVALYRDGMLVPFSEMLMLSRAEIYADARIKLPFWYGVPVISWIMKLLTKKPAAKKTVKKAPQKTATRTLTDEERAVETEKVRKLDTADSFDPKKSRKRELRKAASDVEKILVPAESTLDRELESFVGEWNDRIGKRNHDNLTEDVNNLIRDYLRKTLRSLRSEAFTYDRIKSLAESLVSSPSMMQIKNHPALKHYIELYMVKLVKNLPA